MIGPSGETVDLGRHEVTTEGRGTTVPHLHREVPGRDALSTFSPDARRMTITAADGSSWSAELTGLTGDVTQYRWLADGETVLVATEFDYGDPYGFGGDAQVSIATVDHDAHTLTLGAPVFDPSFGQHSTIRDVRPTPTGALVRAYEMVSGREALHHVTVADGVVQEAVPIHEGGEVDAATVLADGTVIVNDAGDWIYEMEDYDRGTLTAYQVVGGEAKELASWDCGELQSDRCLVENWVPGAERVTYALDSGEIVLEEAAYDDGRRHRRTVVELPGRDTVHTLWLDDDERRVLAASEWHLGVWSATGDSMIAWTPSAEGISEHISSAQFAPDGRSVLVAAGPTLYRVDADGATEVLSFDDTDDPAIVEAQAAMQTNGPAKKSKRSYHSSRVRPTFIDDIVPLPDGRIALTRVTVRSEVFGYGKW